MEWTDVGATGSGEVDGEVEEEEKGSTTPVEGGSTLGPAVVVTA